jgi:oligopeptide/dipeptide ABC transporter ATP-binding protein
MRGNTMSMVFQDPATSLDPTYSVGSQIAETLRAHTTMTAKEARARATELLALVGIPDPAARYDDPPQRLSGGMRQRVVIGAALANQPALLLADEPTTALDVTIQAQILELLGTLVRQLGSTVLLITHDLGVVAQVCDRVGVMYAGQLVEVAPVAELFADPKHPYTRALLDALPTRGARHLTVIDGQVPNLLDPPAGCRFADRCPRRMEACSTAPALTAHGDRSVACWWEEAQSA